MLRDKMRWIYFGDMLEDEYKQCLEEGKDVIQYREELKKIHDLEEGDEKEILARDLMIRMEKEIQIEGYEYYEPSDYGEIQRLLPKVSKDKYTIDHKLIYEKVKGAWYGRSIGCLLGIPIEGWSVSKIKGYLEETGQYPLSMYITSTEQQNIRDKYHISEIDITTAYDRQKVCWYNCVDCFPTDDDLNYPVMAMKIIERYGKDFSADDVAEGWLLGIPGLHACTAERASYRNLMNGILPPKSGEYLNPYREWIGAQIRADFFGYINPGNPEIAARMAFIDASISHTKNGIYGEMFFAALVSLSYVDNITMKERIIIALNQIPSQSRIYRAITSLCNDFKNGMPFEDVINGIHKDYQEEKMFDWCLVIPNALMVIANLLYFEDDFEKAITNTVLNGFDTDCNGATVGSILGLLHGFNQIDKKWYEGLEPRITTSVNGYHSMQIDELVDKTIKIIELNY